MGGEGGTRVSNFWGGGGGTLPLLFENYDVIIASYMVFDVINSRSGSPHNNDTPRHPIKLHNF